MHLFRIEMLTMLPLARWAHQLPLRINERISKKSRSALRKICRVLGHDWEEALEIGREPGRRGRLQGDPHGKLGCLPCRWPVTNYVDGSRPPSRKKLSAGSLQPFIRPCTVAWIFVKPQPPPSPEPLRPCRPKMLRGRSDTSLSVAAGKAPSPTVHLQGR